MNRFLIDYHPAAIAKSLCDKHIVKMPLEEAQMLSHALHRYDDTDDDFPTFCKRMGLQNGPKAHAVHPCTTWAGDTRANFMYGWMMLDEMSREYTNRYRKKHKCSLLLPLLKELAIRIPDGHITSHPQCFGKGNDHLKTDEEWPIQAYRNYYRWKYETTEWCGVYKLRDIPRWLKEDAA